MGVSVQNEPRSGAPGWHKGMAQIMEPDPGQLRPFQHSAEHVQHAVWGDRPAGGAGEYPGVAPRFLSLCFQNAYRILCQGQSAVGVFRFQGCFYYLPVDSGNLPLNPEVVAPQINVFPLQARSASPRQSPVASSRQCGSNMPLSLASRRKD